MPLKLLEAQCDPHYIRPEVEEKAGLFSIFIIQVWYKGCILGFQDGFLASEDF